MNEDTSNVLHARIPPRFAIDEIAKVLWHLRGILVILLVLFVVLTIAMYYGGGAVNTLTRARASAGETLYFCAVTALTIGYGDVVPTTILGRVIAVLLGLQGVLITGVVAGTTVYGIQAAAQRAGLMSAPGRSG
jgi:voltage-gated potassium channel